MSRLVSLVPTKPVCLFATAAWLLACDGPAPTEPVNPTADAYFDRVLPPGFPRPYVPEGEPMTDERIALGRHLFYDTRLSGNGTQSCESCHQQALAFTDGLALAIGSTGETHFRSAMALTNVAYNATLTWASPFLSELPEQALLPMFGEAPVELGMAGQEAELLQRLEDEPKYQALFAAAFPDEVISVRAVVLALGAFQRTILSYRTPYDRLAYQGDEAALTAGARRGMDLFFGEKYECFHCHGTFNFTDATKTANSTFDEVLFHNTGLYNLDGLGAYPASDQGLMRVTAKPGDMGRFRAPTLRNIALTAPYFHDGSAATLDDVLDHYIRGGRLIETGPNAGDGAQSPLRSGFIKPIDATPQERADLLEFLEALTDEAMLDDPALANPWP